MPATASDTAVAVGNVGPSGSAVLPAWLRRVAQVVDVGSGTSVARFELEKSREQVRDERLKEEVEAARAVCVELMGDRQTQLLAR
jgi:hypothetical protein